MMCARNNRPLIVRMYAMNAISSTRKLTDSELLILSTLVYRIDRAGAAREGMKLGDIVETMREVIVNRQIRTDARGSDSLSQQTSYRDWLALTERVLESRHLRELDVAALEIDEYCARMMLLLDSQRNAYFVFAGTGAGEWEDNATAAHCADSTQQLRALRWFSKTCSEQGIKTATVCGHSKGGNKALYVTVRAGSFVDRAVAFDAQGFSREFVSSYGDDILANTSKITMYSLDNDYVNGLLKCIALHSKRIYIEGSHVESPVAFHSPAALFSPSRGSNGHTFELGGEVEQGKLGKAFKDFSDYVMDNADPEEFRQICTCIGAFMENILVPHKSDEDRVARGVELARTEGFALLLNYIVQFFGSVDGESGASYILGLLLPQGKRGETVIDDIALGALDFASDVIKALTKKR